MSHNPCLCGHGWGQHQRTGPIEVRNDGTVAVYPRPEEQPLRCCNRECPCEAFTDTRARWAWSQPNSRKYCWHEGDPPAPVCGKPGRPQTRIASWTPGPSYQCVGCRRWLDDHPEALRLTA